MPDMIIYAMLLAPIIFGLLIIINGLIMRSLYLASNNARNYRRFMKSMKFNSASACVTPEGKTLHKLNCIIRVLFPVSMLPVLGVLLFMPGLLVEPLIAILR
jgi:hypothetical protein